jgi:aspartyl protease family protein
MPNRLPWGILVAILVVLVVLLLAVNHDNDLVARLTSGDFSSLIINIVLAIFVGATVLTLYRDRLSKALEAALFWVMIGIVLLVGYTYRGELRGVADRVLAEIVPSWPSQKGNVVEIARGRAGDFSVRAQVNGARISMVLDSGASAVVLTQEAAKAAGLPLEVLQYTANVDTANGRTRAAPVTLDRIMIGNIVERSVPALIAQPGALRTNLLGMTFLNRLESWEVRGDKLMLRAYP